jgi:calcineurin-like phosphoesterase family protein
MDQTFGWRLATLAGAAVFIGLLYWTFEPVLRDSGSETVEDPGAASTPLPTAGPADPILVGAGDIARCGRDEAEQTAQLLDQVVAAGVETVVFTAGDNAYENGTLEEYEQCYGPNWGRHKDRTRPALGNHEYAVGNADGYFQYYGEVAGEPEGGYYSYDLGSWHIIVLNTSDDCRVVACDLNSAQVEWLRAELAASSAFCTLAIWHDPLFSTGTPEGGERYLFAFWEVLYGEGADVIVNSHEHSYERFAPQTPDGIQEPAYGIREFVVGTGGDSLNAFVNPTAPNSEIRNDNTFGVLRLTLHPATYDWEFIPVAGAEFRDAGTGECHSAPPPLSANRPDGSPPDRTRAQVGWPGLVQASRRD